VSFSGPSLLSSDVDVGSGVLFLFSGAGYVYSLSGVFPIRRN